MAQRERLIPSLRSLCIENICKSLLATDDEMSANPFDVNLINQLPEEQFLQKLEELGKLTLETLSLFQHCRLTRLSLALVSPLSEKYRIRVENHWLDYVAQTYNQLVAIDLSQCYRISDASVRKIIQANPNLTSINLSKCKKITDNALQDLGELSNLRSLLVSGTLVTNRFLVENVNAFRSLTFLDVVGTLVGDSGIEAISSELNISNTRITSPSCSVIATLTTLAILNLSFTRTGDELYRLTALTNVTDLSLDLNSGMDDDTVSFLLALTELRKLSISRTSITNKGCKSLKNLTLLEKLEMEAVGIDDEGLVHVAALKNLKQLSIPYTGISDLGIDELVSLKSLTSLKLSYCSLTDRGLRKLSAFTNLTSLDIGSKSITNAGVIHLTSLTKLVYLTLWETSATDEVIAKLIRGKNEMQNNNVVLSNLTPLDTRISTTSGTYIFKPLLKVI